MARNDNRDGTEPGFTGPEPSGQGWPEAAAAGGVSASADPWMHVDGVAAHNTAANGWHGSPAATPSQHVDGSQAGTPGDGWARADATSADPWAAVDGTAAHARDAQLGNGAWQRADSSGANPQGFDAAGFGAAGLGSHTGAGAAGVAPGVAGTHAGVGSGLAGTHVGAGSGLAGTHVGAAGATSASGAGAGSAGLAGAKVAATAGAGLAKIWPIAAGVVGVLVLGTAVTGGIWMLNRPDEGGAGDDTTEIVAEDDAAGTGDGAGAITQPARETVIENLLTAELPDSCWGMTGPLVDGVYQPADEPWATVTLRWLGDYASPDSTAENETAFGDVTGDGIDDVAVRLFCWPGGVGWPDLIAIYEVGADGSVSPIGGVFPWDFEGITMGESRGTFTNPPAFEDGEFVISGGIDTDGAPDAASSVADTLYTATFTTENGVLVQTSLESEPLPAR